MTRLASSLTVMLSKLREDRGYSLESTIVNVLLGIFAIAVIGGLTAWGLNYVSDLTSR